MSFQTDLKAFRNSRGWTQKQAAELVGVTEFAWWRWETVSKGGRLMPLQLLCQLDPPLALLLSWQAACREKVAANNARWAIPKPRKPGPCPLAMLLHLQREGQTAADLSRDIGVPADTLRRWLAGKSEPIAAYWPAIAKVCPTCLTDRHPMGKTLAGRYRVEGRGVPLAVWLEGINAP